MSEQFENSIRKKLQDAEIPFDPAAWEQMKKRLDDPRRRRPVFFWWILSGLLIFIAAGSFWWWCGQQQTSAERSLASIEYIPHSTTTPSQEKAAGETGPLLPEGLPPASPRNRSSFAEAPATPRRSAATVHQRESSNRDKQAVNLPGETEQVTVVQELPAAAAAKTDTSRQQTPAKVEETTVPAAAPADSLPAKKKWKGFEGGITIGPDVNIASSMKMGRVGLSTGIILRYHFNDRWSIQTGAVYSKKLYGATPKDYHFDYPVTYTKIDADCNVLDIPLNASYRFLIQPGGSWSLVAGASSYFMLNEKYDYFYENGTKRSHEYNNRNHHYFSVLNLGVNWEKRTTGMLQWSLQPYVKVPLGGVGEGKVQLYSAGLSLQVTMGKK